MRSFACILVFSGLLAAPSLIQAAPLGGSVTAPRDMSTGMSTGKRMHKPYVITKDWSSRSAADADCTAWHGAVSEAGGKFTCTVDAGADGAVDVCTTARKSGALCTADFNY